MQKFLFFTVSIISCTINAEYLNYNDDLSHRTKTSEIQDYEPITTFSKNHDIIIAKNVNCDDFSRYTANCTNDAAFIYNSSRMSPPPTSKIYDWCKAIKHLTNCALDWNIDCKDVTDSRFNEESIQGHIHVVNNVCYDEWFLIHYEDLAICIESSTDPWETCYVSFKRAVEEQKNTTREWTHYDVHFQLCCARARFRRCTLELLFTSISPTKCTYEQAITLQKFSVIVSEGAVYQDCDRNMMYANCPGGDPRPTRTMLKRLMSAESINKAAQKCHLLSAIYKQIIMILLLIKL